MMSFMVGLAVLNLFSPCRAAAAFVAPSSSWKQQERSIVSSHVVLQSSSSAPDDHEAKDLGGRRSFLSHTGAAASVFAAATTTAASPHVFPAKPANAAENKKEETTKKDLRDVKVALWGFGNQNQLMAQYLAERKVPVVAVVGRHDIGKDYATAAAGGDSKLKKLLGGKSGVKIVSQENARKVLDATKPDVCLICTRSTISDLKESLTICAESKVNVVTIAEELLDSRTSSPAITNEMNALFQSNGVSLTGSGFIDGACCAMTMTLSSMMHKIQGLEGMLQYNVDDYGPVLAQAHGVGLTKQAFQKEIVEQPQAKSYVYNTNEWFVSALDLTLVETKEERIPTTATVPLYSKSMKKDIPVGDCTGMNVIATTTTKEGVTITSQQIGKCYEKTDQDTTSWGFIGEPAGIRFTMDNTPTVEMTNTATISRILAILEAPSGYVPSYQLPLAPYEYWKV